MQRALLLLVVVAFIPRAAAAQGEPLGPEFRVNTYTTAYQFGASIAADASGNFVVVWTSCCYQDGSWSGVFGQRFASFGQRSTTSGAPVGREFRVNTYTQGEQRNPAVASDASGNFVVVWTSEPFDGRNGEDSVFGQRYASNGAPLGPEFRVTSDVTAPDPAVASDASGNFVVAWTTAYGMYLPRPDVFGRRYASDGTPLGSEFRVNTQTGDRPRQPSIAADRSGNFVIVWQSFVQDGSSWGVFGQRYANTGEPLGPEFRVNTYTTNYQENPAVASDSSGNFVVVWTSNTQDGSSKGVFGQRYASTGAPLGPEFPINTYTALSQQRPAVASDGSGNTIVVWQSRDQEGLGGSLYGVFGQRYASNGAALGSEFRVNAYPMIYPYPSVAADASGRFLVVWRQGSEYGDVFGQRFNRIAPGPSWREPTDPVE